MILNKRHEVLEYLGQKYEIGDIVIAKNCYPYEGLCGVISEIRTDEDKETENCGIDIYCNFFMPYDKEDLKSILERFAKTSGEIKSFKELNLDNVIMAANMLILPYEKQSVQNSFKVYLLKEEWAFEDETGSTMNIFTDIDTAREQFKIKVHNEKHTGCANVWKNEKNLIEEFENDFYEVYLDGWYCSSHYTLKIEEQNLSITDKNTYDLKQIIEEVEFYSDFEAQVEDWEELIDFTEEEYDALIHDKTIPSRMRERMYSYRRDLQGYEDEENAYNLEMSELAHEIVEEHVKRKKDKENGPGNV